MKTLLDPCLPNLGGDTTAPSKVLGLSVTTISVSQLNLAWTINTEPDLAHYNVYRGSTADFAVNTATDSPLAQPVTNSNISFDVFNCCYLCNSTVVEAVKPVLGEWELVTGCANGLSVAVFTANPAVDPL